MPLNSLRTKTFLKLLLVCKNLNNDLTNSQLLCSSVPFTFTKNVLDSNRQKSPVPPLSPSNSQNNIFGNGNFMNPNLFIVQPIEDSQYSNFFKQYKNSFFPSTIVIDRQYFEATLHRNELDIVAPNMSTLVVKRFEPNFDVLETKNRYCRAGS